MSYAGHVFDMINRIKQNRELMKAQRDRRREARQAYLDADTNKHRTDIITRKKITEKQRQEIIQQAIKENKKEIRRKILAFIIAFIIIGVIIYFLFIN